MFGFSLAELVIVLLVAIIFIKPQDLPEIAHFCGRLYYKARKLIASIKSQLQEVEKELGLEEIKHELNRGISEEKMKAQEKFHEAKKGMTKIIDIYGEEHEVNAHEVRGDLTKEELEEEIKRYNHLNSSDKLKVEE